METQRPKDAQQPDFSALLLRVEEILGGAGPLVDRLAALCSLLRGAAPHYDWVGFYLVESPGWLALGPFCGAPTGHVHIPFGLGVCGQAAQRAETLVVQDIARESNYLACSVEVRAEIVVPLLREGEVLGELDIDSHRLAPFTPADRAFLETVAARVARLMT
ncbi:GAF domain-containing protein [bacterium]|nr:GAF domain-containing protein [bacterium]